MINSSWMMIRRLRVLNGAQEAYDDRFHPGVNIIRGENSSGKSTIADFMFFALGGEFDRWKDAARNCTAVQIEIETPQSVLTFHRSVGSKTEPIFVFYGTMEASKGRGVGDWERLPIRRPPSGKELSFSQVVFRAAGIPEAPNAGDSNITMHQVMRLLYADQQTPAGKLFRFESFDTRDIREAVGQLLIGINGYHLYEGQIQLRELKNQWLEKDRLYRAAMVGLPSSEGLASVETLAKRLEELASTKARITDEISRVDALVNEELAEVFVAERKGMLAKVRSAASTLNDQDQNLLNLQDEIQEIEDFSKHLSEQVERLNSAETVAEALGEIEFQYCPACLKPLDAADDTRCIVCHQVIDDEEARSKYFEIKIDVEMQLRETALLLKARNAEFEDLKGEIRASRRNFASLQTEFSARYDVSNSPRETFLAERNNFLGRIDREVLYLEELRSVLERLDKLSLERSHLNDSIVALEARLEKLASSASTRLRSALSAVSAIGCRVLKADLRREDTFETAKSLDVNFGDDAILLDGKMNFAESSNVILKNSAILSLLFAACYDIAFWHPRMLIMDNIEDKGMEPDRSHNFQRILIAEAKKVKLPHQIIFTTSMLAPELEGSSYTVGPKYTRTNKTLRNV